MSYHQLSPIGGEFCRHATASPECSIAHLSLNRRPATLNQASSGGKESNSPQNRASEEAGRAGSRENVIRWTSSNCGGASSTTPLDCLQIETLRCGDFSGQQQQRQVCSEQGHNLLVDGSGYTLLILDCSPQPDADYDCSDSNRGSCDCHNRCFCQTELIVKQQIVPHDHVCRHVCQQQQHSNQQRQYLTTTVDRSNSSRQESSQENDRRQFSEQQQRPQSQQQQFEQQVASNYQYQTQQQPGPNQSNQSTYDKNFTRSEQQPSQPLLTPKQQEQFFQNHQQARYGNSDQNQMTTITKTTTTTTTQNDQLQNRSTLSNQQQQLQLQQQQLQQQQNQQEEQRQKPRQRKKGTQIVKRWDWNQAQFVETEVPEQPRETRNLIAPVRSPSSHSTDIWHQDTLAQPSTSSTAGATSSSVSYGSTSTSKQQQQPDQPWLANRIPDLEAIQSDPLYCDLMLELQKLEEGVKVVEEPVIEPETSQRPVFGQAITPDRIEAKEYENVEFVCRLIPISDPTMKIEWTINGRPLLESSRITNEHEFGVVRLRIKRCEAEDSGVYRCKAINSLGEAVSSATLRVQARGNIQCETLNPAGLDKIRQLENPKPVDHVEEQVVEQPPKFLTHITDYVEKNEGDSVHFECCLGPVDDPDLKTEWFFNGRPLVTGSRFHTIDDFGFIVLDIDWLFPRDTGEYVCRATNKYGTDITRTVLRVKPDKNIVLESQLDNPVIIDKLRQLEFPDVVQEQVVEEPDKPAHFVQQLRSEGNRRQFVEGDNVHFEARVGPATDGNLTVEWFHNDKPLISGHRFKPTFDFGHIQLDLLYVYAEDSGVYKCVTRNATGVDVSEFEIRVTGKPSLVYQSQLPKEMEGGVQKITDMEAMWNRPPDPEEEAPPVERVAPQFVLKPKPYTAFENSCARFCCRIIGVPRPRLTWVVNGQTVVTGSRYKLTYDGMYHLTIPKCQLSDAGKVEVYARNLLGECFATTELKVKRKVDDYRGVLKNSPNPWYDEQSLKVYQRQRSQDLTDDEDFETFRKSHHLQPLQFATEQQSTSPTSNQVIGYMEPGTPDVNLLARTQAPLMEPGDLHPVVMEQQVVMAPAPSTIKRALNTKDTIRTPEKSFNLPEKVSQRRHYNNQNNSQQQQLESSAQDLSQNEQRQRDRQHVFGLDLPRYSSSKNYSLNEQQRLQTNRALSPGGPSFEHRQQMQQDQHLDYQDRLRQEQERYGSEDRLDVQQSSHSTQRQAFDHHLPPPSPESTVHGKEVHSHIHKQTQLERRANKEITREIIEKETFVQEHKGITKENVVRGSSTERGATPARDSMSVQRELTPTVELNNQQRQVHFEEEQQVLITDNMVPPEFKLKIQPCQAIDGDEARFECTFKGDPKPNISWFRETKMIKPSNLYTIITDYNQDKSTLIIKRVTLNSNAVFTVKAENAAGSAKSSANLVVEPHPLPEAGGKAGQARQVILSSMADSSTQQQSGGASSSRFTSSSQQQTTMASTSSSTAGGGEEWQTIGRPASESPSSDSQKVVKSIRTRKLSSDEMAALIRASPEGMIAPNFLHTIHDTTSKPGELARLDARLVGTKPMDVRWLKDGQRVRADRSHKMVLEGDLYTLLILECSQRDEGSYECVATNRVGEARCEARLIVSYGRQSVSRSPELITTSTTAATSSSSSSTVINDQQVAEGQQRTHFGPPRHQFNPMMNQYTNAAGRQQEIPKLIKRLESQQVKEGKSVTLRCQISSFPIPEVQWFKHGDKQIKPSKYFRIFKDNDETYCLKILETFPEDQGEYKCIARSPHGASHVETAAMITVIPNSPK